MTKRILGWSVAVVVLVAWVTMMLYAPQLTPYLAATLGVAVLTGSVMTVVRARRRGVSVATSLRPEGHAISAMQDDLLGRMPSPPLSSDVSDDPVPTRVEAHVDPLAELMAQQERTTEREDRS